MDAVVPYNTGLSKETEEEEDVSFIRTEDYRSALARALLTVSLWSNPTWKDPSSGEMPFLQTISMLWAYYHRLERAAPRGSIADIIGSVRGIIPDSRLATYGDYRYNMEMEDPFTFATNEGSTEAAAGFRTLNLQIGSTVQSSYYTTLWRRPWNITDMTLSNEVDFHNLYFHPTVNNIVEDLERGPTMSMNAKFLTDWIKELQGIFFQLRHLSLRCEQVRTKWVEHLLNVSSRFLKAAVLNPSLCNYLRTGIPLSVNYDQLLTESASEAELWSIPQPALDQSEVLDPNEVRRLWAVISSPKVRTLWKPPKEISIFGSLPAPLSSTVDSSDAVILLTSFLLRNNEITKIEMHCDSSVEPLDDDEIDEKLARHLLGSLLDLIGSERERRYRGVRGQRYPATSFKFPSGKRSGHCSSSPGYSSEEDPDLSSNSCEGGRSNASSARRRALYRADLLLKKQEENVRYIMYNWSVSQAQGPLQNALSSPPETGGEEGTERPPSGYCQTPHTTTLSTALLKFAEMNSLPANCLEEHNSDLLDHLIGEYKDPPVIEFPPGHNGSNASEVPSTSPEPPTLQEASLPSTSSEPATSQQASPQRNSVPSTSRDETLTIQPEVSDPDSKTLSRTRDCLTTETPALTHQVQPRETQDRGKLTSHDKVQSHEQNRSEARASYNFRRTRSHKDVYVPPHAREGWCSSFNQNCPSQNQEHIDIGTWLFQRSCLEKSSPNSEISTGVQAQGTTSSENQILSTNAKDEGERFSTQHVGSASSHVIARDSTAGNEFPRLPATSAATSSGLDQKKSVPNDNPSQVEFPKFGSRYSEVLKMGCPVSERHVGDPKIRQILPKRSCIAPNLGEKTKSSVLEDSSCIDSSKKPEKCDLQQTVERPLHSSRRCSSFCDPGSRDKNQLVDVKASASLSSEWPLLPFPSSTTCVRCYNANSRAAMDEIQQTEILKKNEIFAKRRKRKRKPPRNFYKCLQNGGNNASGPPKENLCGKKIQQMKGKYSGGTFKVSPPKKNSAKIILKYKQTCNGLANVKGIITSAKQKKTISSVNRSVSDSNQVPCDSSKVLSTGSFKPTYSDIVQKGHSAMYCTSVESVHHSDEESKSERPALTNSEPAAKESGPGQESKAVDPCYLPPAQDPEQEPKTVDSCHLPPVQAPAQEPKTVNPYYLPRVQAQEQEPEAVNPCHLPTAQAPGQEPEAVNPCHLPAAQTPGQEPDTVSPCYLPHSQTPRQDPKVINPCNFQLFEEQGTKTINPCFLQSIQDSELFPGVLSKEVEVKLFRMIKQSRNEKMLRSHSGTVCPAEILHRLRKSEDAPKSESAAKEQSINESKTCILSYSENSPESGLKSSGYSADGEYQNVSDDSSIESFGFKRSKCTQDRMSHSDSSSTTALSREINDDPMSEEEILADLEKWSRSDCQSPRDSIEKIRVSTESPVLHTYTDFDEMESIFFSSSCDDILCEESSPSGQEESGPQICTNLIVSSTPISKANREETDDGRSFRKRRSDSEGKHHVLPMLDFSLIKPEGTESPSVCVKEKWVPRLDGRPVSTNRSILEAGNDSESIQLFRSYESSLEEKHCISSCSEFLSSAYSDSLESSKFMAEMSSSISDILLCTESIVPSSLLENVELSFKDKDSIFNNSPDKKCDSLSLLMLNFKNVSTSGSFELSEYMDSQ